MQSRTRLFKETIVVHQYVILRTCFARSSVTSVDFFFMQHEQTKIKAFSQVAWLRLTNVSIWTDFFLFCLIGNLWCKANERKALSGWETKLIMRPCQGDRQSLLWGLVRVTYNVYCEALLGWQIKSVMLLSIEMMSRLAFCVVIFSSCIFGARFSLSQLIL
jgi:hypothetical protein